MQTIQTMQKALFLSAFALFLCQTACKPGGEKTPAAAALTFEMRDFSKKNCLGKPERCAEISLKYPQFAGSNALAATAINDTIRHFVLMAMGANHALPFATALDSATVEFMRQFAEFVKETEVEIGWANSVDAKVLFQNDKIATLEIAHYIDIGGAHPNHATALHTFDLATGRALSVRELVKDTAALLAMLEKGFRDSKELKADENLADVLYPDLKSLPLPANAAVVPEGLRFYYNPYEVAAYVFGETDLTFTWEQLGALAERSRWLDAPAKH